jgi:hypothetical protein
MSCKALIILETRGFLEQRVAIIQEYDGHLAGCGRFLWDHLATTKYWDSTWKLATDILQHSSSIDETRHVYVRRLIDPRDKYLPMLVDHRYLITPITSQATHRIQWTSSRNEPLTEAKDLTLDLIEKDEARVQRVIDSGILNSFTFEK